jgi:tetratricopeptide (TPR) repeat protein
MAPLQFTPDGTKLIVTCAGSRGLAVWDLRQIRRRLKATGLDWDWPDFQPERDNPNPGYQKVEVLIGDLAASSPSREQLARQRIDRYRRELKANPESAKVCNSLAWLLVTAEADLRDVKAALPLAEKALRLESDNAHFRNTLGVAYYRDGRYRDAIETLRPNLEKQADGVLAFDLYFLAMSYHRLGETSRGRDYYNWAVRWAQVQDGLTPAQYDQMTTFRVEAEALFKSVEKTSK